MKKLLFIFLTLSFQTMSQQIEIKSPVKFLALGDSYTIGESVAIKERWPVQLAEHLRQQGLTCSDPTIIATTGWRTDNLKAAIEKANLKPEYTLVSLLIGVNNFYQGKSAESYKPEFEELLQTAITLAQGDKDRVIVVSIPDYGFTPFGEKDQPRITAGIDEFNRINKSVAAKLNITYVDITDISRNGLAEPDLVAEDGLHPSGKMYGMWVKRILSRIHF